MSTYVTYETEFGLEAYISSNMSRQIRSLMAQFLLGILPITVETGTFRNISLQDRKCTICDLNEVEDEKHFLCIHVMSIMIQDCFLQKEARVCVSNAFVLEDSMFKSCFFVVVEDEQVTEEADMLM